MKISVSDDVRVKHTKFQKWNVGQALSDPNEFWCPYSFPAWLYSINQILSLLKTSFPSIQCVLCSCCVILLHEWVRCNPPKLPVFFIKCLKQMYKKDKEVWSLWRSSRESIKISKNNSTWENAVSQTLYGSWMLRVMGSCFALMATQNQWSSFVTKAYFTVLKLFTIVCCCGWRGWKWIKAWKNSQYFQVCLEKSQKILLVCSPC